MDDVLRALQERAKELECLYRVDEILQASDLSLPRLLEGLVKTIPPAWQYPAICRARITVGAAVHESPDFVRTRWRLWAPIAVEGTRVGSIEVVYLEETQKAEEGPFLPEEETLLRAIAERLGRAIEHQRMRQAFENLESARDTGAPRSAAWGVILDFLRRTDESLLARIARKMINHLGWLGVDAAVQVLHQMNVEEAPEGTLAEENQPLARLARDPARDRVEETFRIAASVLSDDEIIGCLQKWIKEDKSRFMATALGNPDATLDEVGEAIRRYHHLGPEGIELPLAARKGMRVALIEHLFTDQLEFINTAKQHLDIDDFFDLVQHVVSPPRSRGKLGGKSAGLFLASRILARAGATAPRLREIRMPRTWYITSDGLVDFIQYNNLEDIQNHKYADIDQVRQEYPHIVQVFKNSAFTPDVVRGLSQVLDDFTDVPIIVRSSSLLEDRLGSAFSGKYKSLFLANEGAKARRLAALQDAVAEVYASTFGPDPIEYRSERGLIDAYEEMGIMIQEVVGTRVGRWFLPAFSGVAFSRNEFRWSARIRREDGLVRIVPGLGTRAVDRLKDDYPVLLAPGQPGLRVNVTPEEVLRYSPRFADAINLESGAFETVPMEELLRAHGAAYPLAAQILSKLEEGHLRRPVGTHLDFERDTLIVTFEGLAADSPFMRQIKEVLETLERAMGVPVDIEFASDGQALYLLQCRPQSSAGDAQPAPIPRHLPDERVLFTASRFVSNGRLPDLTHIVYVDPARYNALADVETMRAVGRAVGRLNKILPKRQFVLMGPGRWGSRGDIKLGVSVTYADINNTALLVEIARKKGNYLPDLSFGTHFFQDLVEASIRYLPLYPDDPGVRFDERFFDRVENVLPSLLPEYASLAGVLKVIDVPRVMGGQILRVLMNADLDEAVALFAPPQATSLEVAEAGGPSEGTQDQHWRWRLRFAERIAASLDAARFGVRAVYVIGSTKNATAGPASDIDLIVHVGGTGEQRRHLESWFQGWSAALAEMNFLRTGYRSDGLLDVHYVTDEDFVQRTSFAVKVGAVTDAARPLPLSLPPSGA
ncbi:MAG TPA: PEP/pyruvate-binding domain-containing protein [Acidobacteriota bacterium]|nr:PEP/pyruvate-binding domain-containing protein [Acidobacteriota bacterium]